MNIEINGICFKNDTNIYEVLNNPQFQFYGNNDSSVDIFTSKKVVIDRYIFNIKVFFINKQIEKIQLTPTNLDMKDPGYPDKEYQEEKKKIADSFLRAKLGKPLKENEAVLYYEFDWGSISSIAFLGGRNEYAGGFIEISYKR